MAPLFSKIAIPPFPNMPVVSGLICGHAGCPALFSDLEDLKAHAVAAHVGDVRANTCGIYERRLENGELKLHRVLDENDEDDKRCGEKTPNGEKNEGQSQLETGEAELGPDESETKSSESTQPTPVSDPLGTNGETACRTGQLDTRFVRASTLLPSTNSPFHCEPPLVPTQTPQAIVSRAILSSIDQASMPAGQSPSHHPAQPLSRHSTSSSISSFSSEDGGDDTSLKLNRIFSMVQEVFHERCRICWVERTRSQSHPTFHCPKALCSGTEWKSFKSDLRFPTGKVCYFCMAPYCSPFNHARPPPGVPWTADLCDYPDVLKELSYILYAKWSLHEKIFGRLGHAMPQTLEEYKRHVSSRPNGGTFGAYNVIYAYLEVREEEKALA